MKKLLFSGAIQAAIAGGLALYGALGLVAVVVASGCVTDQTPPAPLIGLEEQRTTGAEPARQGGKVTPRGSNAKETFEALRGQGIVVLRAGSDDLIVPAKLRFQPVDGRVLVEAVARFHDCTVCWKEYGGRSYAIIRAGALDETVRQLAGDLQSEDSARRRDGIERAWKIDDVRKFPPLVAAALRADGNLSRSACEQLSRQGWTEAFLVAGEPVLSLAEKVLSGPRAGPRAAAAGLLFGMGGKRSLQLLDRALEDADPGVRAAAVRALPELAGDRALERLGKVLADRRDYYSMRDLEAEKLPMNAETRLLAKRFLATDPGESPARVAAVEALGRLGGEGAIKLLVRATKDPDELVRRGACAALGRTGGSRAVEALAKTLKDEDVCDEASRALAAIGGEAVVSRFEKLLADPELRYQALAGLGLCGGERALALLEKALVDREPSVRRCAAAALGELGGERAAKPLKAALDDRETSVRWTAAEALVRASGPRALGALAKPLADVKEVRLRAVAALGEIGGEAVVPPLRKAMSDPDVYVAGCAEKSLSLLGDRGAQLAILGPMLADPDPASRRRAMRLFPRTRDERCRDLLLARFRTEQELAILQSVRAALKFSFAEDHLVQRVLAERPEQEPRLVKVLFERQVPPEKLKRYALTGSRVTLDTPYTEEELRKNREDWARSKTVLKAELYFDPASGRHCIRYTLLGEDLDLKARIKRWREHALKNLAAGRDCGPYAFTGSMVNAYPDMRLIDGQSGCMSLRESYTSTKLGGAAASIYEVAGSRVTVHQLLGLIRGEDWVIERTEAGPAVTTKRGDILCWRSGGQMVVKLGGGSRRVRELLPLYAAKYPSDLPADVKLDWTAWAREELEAELATMKRAADSLPGEEAREALQHRIGNVAGFAYVPLVSGVGMRYKDQLLSSMEAKPSAEQLRKQYEVLAAWWAEKKDSTYWHKEGRKLVAKGEEVGK